MTLPSEPPQPHTIRACRMLEELTQAQAARMVHVATRTWQQWEAGHRAMHPAFFELFLIKARRPKP